MHNYYALLSHQSPAGQTTPLSLILSINSYQALIGIRFGITKNYRSLNEYIFDYSFSKFLICFLIVNLKLCHTSYTRKKSF